MVNFADYRPRLVDRRLGDLLAEFPAVMINGARATGKTTTARRHVSAVLSLDIPGYPRGSTAGCGLDANRRRTSGLVDEHSGQRHKRRALAKATAGVNGLPESVPSARRRHPHLYGTLVALVGFLLVALPVAVSTFLAVLSFSGCQDSGSGPVFS